MKNSSTYKSWRDQLLEAVSERICKPCVDERKKQFKMDYDNPLECGCRCDRVESILAHAKKIDEDMEKILKN